MTITPFTPDEHRTRRRHVLPLVATWALLIVIGTTAIARHAGTPGQPATIDPPIDFSGAAPLRIARAAVTPDVRWTLVMAVHPLCPCSRASLAELERLLVRHDGELTATVLFLDTTDMDASKTELWDTAQRIRGVRPVRDPHGVAAERLHARTSGQTFLYDPAGVLRFSGGITASRGHVGDNAGADAIETILAAPNVPSPLAVAPFASTAVFGCALR